MFYCFHAIALLFMSARPILVHFFPFFDGLSSELPEIAKFSLKIVILFILNTSLPFWCKILSGGGATFNFRPILADFHMYTLNMTSYHVTEAIYGYF